MLEETLEGFDAPGRRSYPNDPCTLNQRVPFLLIGKSNNE
jgi:hypothetical protein